MRDLSTSLFRLNAFAALLVLLLLTIVEPVIAAPLPLSEDQEMDLRIVELRLRQRTVLSDQMLAYGDGEDLLIPLSETLVALGFPIDVDAEQGTAKGWFLRENQTFQLDIDAGVVDIAGHEDEFDRARIRTDGVDLFVPLQMLTDWFELNAVRDEQTQTVSIEPAYLLIAEEQAKRAKRGGGTGSRKSRLDIDALEKITAPYKWIDWPHGSVDLSLNTTTGANSATTGQGNLKLTGDLLKMTGELFVSASSEGRKDARLVLGRSDASGNLFAPVLGPYGATQFRMGDISTSTHPVLEGGGAGLGFTISRSPLRQGGDFDTTRIEGDAFPGWQAELYRDGQLLGNLTISSSGRYVFEDVPLTFGVNRFRIELYGPSGERRTIDRPVDIANNFIRRGEIQYKVEMAAIGRGVFTNRQDPSELDFEQDASTSATPVNGVGSLNDGYVGFAEVAMGLGERMSGSAGVQLRGGDTQQDRQTAFMSLSRRGGTAIVTGDFAVDDRGETAVRLGYTTEIRGVSVNVSAENRSTYFGTQTTSSTDSATVTNRVSLRLDGRAKTPWLSRDIGWSLAASGSERADGGTSMGVQGRVSGQIGGLSLSESLNWRSDTSPTNGRNETANSALSVSGTLGAFRVRGGLDFDILPDWEPRQAQVELSRRYDNWYGRVNYAHKFADDSGTFGAALSKDFNGVRLGIDVRQELDTNVTTGLLTLGFDFDRNPNGSGMRFGRDARSNRGVAKVRVYEDVNLDGKYSRSEDRLIEDAAVIAEPRSRLVSNTGMVVLDDLSTDQLIGLAVDRDQLADPYLVPATKGVSFTARPGGAVAVDLPVVLSGEVELALKTREGKPREGVIAELQRCDATEPAIRERAAFDGYVFFQFVKPGCYDLRVPGMIARRFELQPGDVSRQELSFAPENTIPAL